ncbi:unnamed protein product [Blepharisma stoltei]|uniref:Uncharacterized protein n=1 Tax=Blepharisma stoltei TaxID=1481888 RepID=A0AAU9ILV1_9CILI|nr:unnamed protein product [Blepharisma stoltei]
MDSIKQKFYYKLVLLNKSKYYTISEKPQELVMGDTTEQNLLQSSLVYVYRTQELALSNEIRVKDPKTHLSPKTVIKIMCWGDSKEEDPKYAFSFMCPILDVGFPFKPQKPIRDVSRRSKIIPPKELRSLPYWRDITPCRYGLRKLPSPKLSVRSISHINWRVKSSRAYEKLRKMEEETEKLEKEISEIEKFADLLDLENDDFLKDSAINESIK